MAPGFTFVEVLFAIIILGVGTIMLAGMLPVAIKQSSDTRNDITGRGVCEAGYGYLKTLAQSQPTAFPVTSDVTKITAASLGGLNDSPRRMVPLNYSVINAAVNNGIDRLGPHLAILGSRVSTTDPRFQWLAFYGRAVGEERAHVVVLALRLQNIEQQVGGVPMDRYRNETLTNEQLNADNGPFLLTAEVRDGGPLDADTIMFTDSASTVGLGALESGAFVVVASQAAVTNDAQRPYRNNGRVFRLGAHRTDLETAGGGVIYDLQPGYDLPAAGVGADGLPNTADDEIDGSMNPTNTMPGGSPVNNEYRTGASTVTTGTDCQVWVVGRGLANPGLDYSTATPTNLFTGPAQDISALSADLPLAPE